MADLPSWCLAIDAEIEGKRCPECGGDGIHECNTGGGNIQSSCPACHGSGKAPPEVCEGEEQGTHSGERCKLCNGLGKWWEENYNYPPCKECGGLGVTPRTIYQCPIVLVCADWLEEHGDPRAEMLRGMRIENGVDSQGDWFMIADPLHEKDISYWRSLADASRELLRRALALLTVPCPNAGDAPDHLNKTCRWCSGRGWLAADAVKCPECIERDRLTGTPIPYTGRCISCKGTQFVKIPLLNRPSSV